MAERNVIWSDRKRTLFGLPLSFTKYTLTEERLFIQTGLFTTVEDEVRLYRILDVKLTRTLGQKIFGVGSIHVCSADKSMADFEITSIKNSADVKEKLSELVEKNRVEKRVMNREAMFGQDVGYDEDDEENLQ
ncbi:MAG: PH domain-containing protein [Lachnospiraceae bacterium]|nr:PH domain-containing protein [Lachnospiraceae bacterium]